MRTFKDFDIPKEKKQQVIAEVEGTLSWIDAELAKNKALCKLVSPCSKCRKNDTCETSCKKSIQYMKERLRLELQ